jgi:hypothetical protein
MTSVFGDFGISGAQVGQRLHPGYRSGAYYSEPAAVTIDGTMAADTIYAYPIRLAAPMTVQFVATRLGFAAAGVSGKVALYTNILTDGRLIAESPSLIDCNVTGIVGGTFGANPTCPPGVVWAAWKFNGAARPGILDPAALANTPLFNLFGQTNANPFIISSSAIIGARRADAFANAFPATFGAITWTAGAPGAPVTSLQVV